VELSVNYKQVNVEKNDGWYAYNSPYSSLTLSFEPLFVSLENRHEFEYWFADEKSDYGRYRNRIKVYPQFGMWFSGAEFYIAEEVFIKLNSDRLSALRSYVGFDFELLEKFELGLYYCLQQKETDSGWNSSHVLGTNIKLYYLNVRK
jgi:hypothetical protein